MIQLRDYQRQVINDVNNAWSSGAQNVCAVMPTGAGKTTVFSSIIHDEKSPVVAIAHRQELVTQISLSLARFEVPHQIIGPDSVIKLCNRIHMEELGQSFYHPQARCAVAGVDTLIRRNLGSWAGKVKLWVQDECFPAGTMIDGTPIEKIQVGDWVTSFDEKSGRFAQKQVTNLFVNPMPKHMVRLTAGHHVLECTHGHPLWTKEGWKDAGEITRNDFLYMVRGVNIFNERTPTVQVEKDGVNILSRQTLWVQPQGSQTEEGVARSIVTKKTSGQQSRKLHNVFNTCDNNWLESKVLRGYWQGVLWERMFNRGSTESVVRDDGENESKICVTTHEKQQSHEKPNNSGESFGDSKINWSRTESERGERKTTNPIGSNIELDVLLAGVSIADNRSHGLSHWSKWLSKPLQNRLRKLKFKIGDRSRRVESLLTEPSTARREENRVFEWVRVDNFEVYEPRNCDNTGKSDQGGFVYNIEVEDFHTYVANGVVVHNCHHLLAPGTNKWGTAAAMFPNARGLGVTATPMRADGKGLGRHADGLMDAMVLGPSMRDLINRGFLCDYTIHGPTSDLRLDPSEVGASGDYSPKQLRNAAKKSHIVGDVVEHYIRIARGKLGITFATDVETAGEITKQFNENGVPAALVHAGTPDSERIALTRRFARRELLQLVNVDLFGEGYDLPALEVVSFARPTESYGLYVQQFGRPLRPSPGKDRAIIIDHVDNIVGRHGLPDRPRQWTLDRRDKRRSTAATDVIPLRYCPDCTQPYERIHKQCPWCGHVAIPATRNGPEQVDGDLTELDPATLAMLRGQVEVVDISVEDYGRWLKSRNVPDVVYAVNIKRHVAKQESQRQLREEIAWWAGEWRAKGSTDSEIYRRFYFKFGVDVMTAKTLGLDESNMLRERIIYERTAMVG